MNDSLKVQAHHLERKAYLYVRQSSMRQVLENVESTKRQYALRSRATALGWPADHIVVIDSDQGESGASGAWREGFQHLVVEVGMGHAGIVMGLEVSRLARNNADWHRLLEICALSETLILDEDGVYDPQNFNDRLQLGLKGTMSEAELHVLKARLRGGILNKVRRGEYRCTLPTGLVYDDSGEVVLDPDSQVRETIAYFFETFYRFGSANQTVKAFKRERLLFPSQVSRSGRSGIVYRSLTISTAMRVLHNPRYAGAYAYGRRRYRRKVDGKKTCRNLEGNEWQACIPDAHPGYISWSRYQEHLQMLSANGRRYGDARISPPREGSALLQGRAVCGRCGCYLRARYATRRGRTESWYVCDRDSSSRGDPNCQSIAGSSVDEAIATLVVEVMTPEAVDLALQIRQEIETRQQEADRLRDLVVERAQFDADLAQRRFMMIDPANRLVADTLEADWNDKLRALAAVREERDRQRRETQLAVDGAIRERLVAMTVDFGRLWADPATSNRDRKRMLAYLIEDATLIKVESEGIINIQVRFKGGRTQTLTVPNPKTSAQKIATSSVIVSLIDRLLDDHIYSEIADILNERGLRPGGSARAAHTVSCFTPKRVAYVVRTYGLRDRYDRLRDRGMLTGSEITERLGIHAHTLSCWAKHGIVRRHAVNGHYYLYEDPGPDGPKRSPGRWNRLADRAVRIQEASIAAQLGSDLPEEV